VVIHPDLRLLSASGHLHNRSDATKRGGKNTEQYIAVLFDRDEQGCTNREENRQAIELYQPRRHLNLESMIHRSHVIP
jgi:hypothetical protein